jgi:hypothetical protein
MKDVCDRVVVYVMPSLSLCSSRLAMSSTVFRVMQFDGHVSSVYVSAQSGF